MAGKGGKSEGSAALKENQGSVRFAAAIDLGGTKVLAAVVNDAYKIMATAKVKTDVKGGPEGIIDQMATGVRKAVKKAGIKVSDLVAVGACAPGPVNPQTGIVSKAVNLGWSQDLALGSLLSQGLDGTPVFVENDVNAGTYGEVIAGVAVGRQDVIGIFVGTGIGGGIVLDGKLRRGHRYSAAELGHTIVLAGGAVCGCGNRGCIEAMASRTALERMTEAALADGRTSVVTELMAKNPGRLTSGVIAAALESGDPLMLELMDRINTYLGLFTASMVNVLDPEMVVYGGGLIEKLGEEMLGPIRRTAEANYLQKQGQVPIVAAQLSDHAAIIGAAALAFDAFG